MCTCNLPTYSLTARRVMGWNLADFVHLSFTEYMEPRPCMSAEQKQPRSEEVYRAQCATGAERVYNGTKHTTAERYYQPTFLFAQRTRGSRGGSHGHRSVYRRHTGLRRSKK